MDQSFRSLLRIGEVKLPVVFKIGMKSHSKEAFLEIFLNAHPIGEIKEHARLALFLIRSEKLNLASLFNQKTAIRAIVRYLKGQRALELEVFVDGGQGNLRIVCDGRKSDPRKRGGK